MKKNIAILLVVALALSLVACGNSQTEQPTIGGGDKPQTARPTSGNNDQVQTEATKPQEPDDSPTIPSVKDWGNKLGSKYVNYNGVSSQVVFRWPVVDGDRRGTGQIAHQDDGTIVVFDSYSYGNSPEVDSIESVFPAYFEQTIGVFSSHYKRLGNGTYSDASFTIENTEIITAGKYEWHKHTGKHIFKWDGEDRSRAYVIYLTTSEENGGYFYILVSDITADQSAGAQMEENAYMMALTVTETYGDFI